MESQQKKAVQHPSRQNTFKTKHLNVWVSARTAFFNIEKWKACENKDLDIEQFKAVPCLISADLASKIDLAAAVNLFYRRESDGKIHYYCVAPKFYIPEDTIFNGEEKQVIKLYQKWHNMGLIDAHDTAENDLNKIADDITDMAQHVALTEVPLDEWGGFQIVSKIEEKGYTAVKIPKTTKSFSPAMRELEAAIAAKRFHHDGNPILTWMISNVVAKPDANDNVFPRKPNNSKKIDGAIALLMGINRAMFLAGEADPNDFYDDPIMVGV